MIINSAMSFLQEALGGFTDEELLKWVLFIAGAILLILWLKRRSARRRQRGLEREFSEALGLDPRDGGSASVGRVEAIEETLRGVNSLLSTVSEELTEAGVPEARTQPAAEVLKNLSPEMRQKLAIPLGIVAQGELTSLASLHIELVRKVAEINYRLVAKRERAVIEHTELTMHAEMLSKNVSVLMKGVRETQEVLDQDFAQLEGPMKSLGQIFLAETAKSTLSKIQKTQGLPDITAEKKIEEVIQVILPPEERPPSRLASPDEEDIDSDIEWEELKAHSNGHRVQGPSLRRAT